MRKEWSELNKTLQLQLKREETFSKGIQTLLTLRNSMMCELMTIKSKIHYEDFYNMTFPNVNSYHNKTIAYSIWHIFRIEDIVAHRLILRNEEVFLKYQATLDAPIITTGNELVEEQIVDFSKELEIEALYQYALAVKYSTDNMLGNLSYSDLKRGFSDEDRDLLESLHEVSTSERAYWLIDFWCNKNVRGLIQMPFSRHWIMHVEASIRIEDKIIRNKV